MKKLVQCQWGGEAQNFVNKKVDEGQITQFSVDLWISAFFDHF